MSNLSQLSAQANRLTLAPVAQYNKNSIPVLQVDAQFTVIESALRGYVKWRATFKHGSDVDVRHGSLPQLLEKTVSSDDVVTRTSRKPPWRQSVRHGATD